MELDGCMAYISSSLISYRIVVVSRLWQAWYNLKKGVALNFKVPPPFIPTRGSYNRSLGDVQQCCEIIDRPSLWCQHSQIRCIQGLKAKDNIIFLHQRWVFGLLLPVFTTDFLSSIFLQIIFFKPIFSPCIIC